MYDDQEQKNTLFNRLYEEYADRILNFVRYLVKNTADAEEIAQEAFVNIYRNLDKYDETKGKYSTWMYTIARNLAYNHLKRKKNQPNLSVNQDIKIGNDKIELIRTIQDTKEKGAYKHLELKELKETVQRAIQSLPGQYMEVITLCDIHGMQHSEVATILECSVNAIDIRLTRARKKLVDIIRLP